VDPRLQLNSLNWKANSMSKLTNPNCLEDFFRSFKLIKERSAVEANVAQI
jgi:hypothetical protein